MPVVPASFGSASVITARALNTSLYTYQPGNNHAPTGILFHSMPPLLVEAARAAFGFQQVSTPSGSSSETPLIGTGAWQNMCDTSAVFSIGADLAGQEAYGQFVAEVPGSSGTSGVTGGTASTAGGWTFIWGFPIWAKQTNSGGAGVVITIVSGGTVTSNATFGGFQQSSTALNNAPYGFDLVNVGTLATAYALSGLCADNSSHSFSYVTNSTYSGTTCRFMSLWACSSAGSQVPVSSIPTIQSTWLPTTVVSSALLNQSITTTLEFLNYPPTLRLASNLSTSLTASTANVVPLTSPSIDTHSGWTSGTVHSYTVPVNGVYLVHACPNINSTAGADAYAGVFINGTRYFGPAYTVPGGSATTVRPQLTHLVDLHAGDTVQLFAYPTATTTLQSAQSSRLIVKWMATLAGSSNSVSWQLPDMWYRWQAGEPGGSLPSLFTRYVGNDLSFLINRPYFLGFQGTAQTGLSQSTWATVHMDTASGLIHSSAGDNYGGWVSGTANHYAAKVPGWYMAVMSISQATPSSSCTHVAGIGYYTAAGAPQQTVPDVYQCITSNTSSSIPGAEAIGLYYLDVGDYLVPQYQETGVTTFATSVAAGHNSTFGVVWVSE